MNGRQEPYDDLDSRRPNGRFVSPTNSGMIGFIASMVALGFLVVVFVLNIFLNKEEQQRENIDRVRLMYIWFLVLDLFTFVGGLTATVMCGRGLSPANPLYRGWSVFGLILGILEMICAVGFGVFMMCAVAFLGMRG